MTEVFPHPKKSLGNLRTISSLKMAKKEKKSTKIAPVQTMTYHEKTVNSVNSSRNEKRHFVWNGCFFYGGGLPTIHQRVGRLKFIQGCTPSNQAVEATNQGSTSPSSRCQPFVNCRISSSSFFLTSPTSVCCSSSSPTLTCFVANYLMCADLAGHPHWNDETEREQFPLGGEEFFL